MRVTACIVLLLAAAGCGGSGPEGWSATEPAELSAEDQARLDRATKAVKTLSVQLAGRLQAALATGTPVDAIGVCKAVAPGLTRAVGDKEELLIGRTSHRLRNEGNRPPAWVQTLLDEIPENPAVAENTRVFLAGDGRMGVTFPITTKPFCLTCHGPDENVPPDVQARIAEVYPEDHAMGFTPGELRGLFWVEVPPGN